MVVEERLYVSARSVSFPTTRHRAYNSEGGAGVTDTPRTDAFFMRTDIDWDREVQFAQQLERELTSVTEQRDGLRSAVDYASDQLSKVTEQRDEARATCSELVVDSDAITLARTVVHITQERDEAREQRDRLLEQQEQWRLSSVCRELVEQRDRLAAALQKVVTSWDDASWLDNHDFEAFREVLRSLTTTEP